MTYEWRFTADWAAVRLLMPFSVWLISLACAITNLPSLGGPRRHWSLCTGGANQFVSYSDVLILRFSRGHWRTLIAVCLHLQVYAVLFAGICTMFTSTYIRYENLGDAGHYIDLTLFVSNIINTVIAKQDTTDSPSPNCYRYKIAICKWWVGLLLAKPKALGLEQGWHSTSFDIRITSASNDVPSRLAPIALILPFYKRFNRQSSDSAICEPP